MASSVFNGKKTMTRGEKVNSQEVFDFTKKNR